MSILKESESDILIPRLQEQERPEPSFVRSYPILIGWRKEDLEQLEREGRRPVAIKKHLAPPSN